MEEEKLSPAARIKALKDRLQQMESEIERLKAENEELQQKVATLRGENGDLRSSYNRLKLVRSYGWDEKSKRAATLRINNLLHEIDNCLALLGQELHT